jgi:hypothetical protein
VLLPDVAPELQGVPSASVRRRKIAWPWGGGVRRRRLLRPISGSQGLFSLLFHGSHASERSLAAFAWRTTRQHGVEGIAVVGHAGLDHSHENVAHLRLDGRFRLHVHVSRHSLELAHLAPTTPGTRVILLERRMRDPSPSRPGVVRLGTTAVTFTFLRRLGRRILFRAPTFGR